MNILKNKQKLTATDHFYQFGFRLCIDAQESP